MKRFYYSKKVSEFLEDSDQHILGELVIHHYFAVEDTQRNAWLKEIQILKKSLNDFKDAYIGFEYSIPRMGKKVDVIIIFKNIIFLLEFKVGEDLFHNSAINQVLDYSMDLKNFHAQSHNIEIVPIVIATEAKSKAIEINKYHDGIYEPVCCNNNNIESTIKLFLKSSDHNTQINPEGWLNSSYKPTPTIIEAAQAIYKGHNVKDISRSDSGTQNLSATSKAISQIIEDSKKLKQKSICFVTGVPGAGKTLAGLNIANERHNIDEGEHAVFLSGNGPLVDVLQEALARDEVKDKKGTNQHITKNQSLSKTKAFIQNIHHFRDDVLQHENAPIERVAVFDEAQRAWTLEQTRSFMAKKKGIDTFNMSEPRFLISVFDRHPDWSVIICLIGGGQEINTGEAGLTEWFSAIQEYYPHWKVYVSNRITDYEYTNGNDIFSKFNYDQVIYINSLHLSVSIRSFRSEILSTFVKSFLDHDCIKAKDLLRKLIKDYPIYVTRELETAKNWLRSNARGNESMGIIASSGAIRLKAYGLHIKSDTDPKTWFLNEQTDVRSSAFLEDVATEFEIQGLELDWTCVAWDANLRKKDNGWEYKNFKGTKWQDVKDTTRKSYLLNSYRVLLTRARQGMIIFIPNGDVLDETRLPEFYNTTYNYFVECGINVI